MLNIRELLQGTPLNLRWVQRYSASRCYFPENVAEHSYFVCLYAKAIVDWVWDNDTSIHEEFENEMELLGDVMSRAVLHDVEEARSGDVNRPFKLSTPELTAALHKAACAAFRQAVDKVWKSQPIKADWFQNWHDAKTRNHRAGCIVALADFLSVLSFILVEGGNEALERLNARELDDYYNSFVADPRMEFLRPLINQAGAIVEEIWDGKK